MTEQKLISKLQELKQIKPREDWVILAKSEIFRLSGQMTKSKAENRIIKPAYSNLLNNILSVVFQRKLAYALAAFLFIVTGAFGFISYLSYSYNINVTQESPVALTAIKSNVEAFKEKSKNLSEIAKYESPNIALAVEEVKDAAEELTEAIKKDPQLAKDIALEVNNNKTYLNISGGESDLQGTLDILYKTTVEKLFEDFDFITLTEDKQESLNRIKSSFKEGKYENRYTDALEDILLFSAAVDNETN